MQITEHANRTGIGFRLLRNMLGCILVSVVTVVATAGTAVATSGGPPVTSAGTPQDTAIDSAFPTLLAVSGAPAGADVTFTAPSSGASGTFSTTGTDTVTVAADGTGDATAPTFVANGSVGSYVVTASVSGVQGSANFMLANDGIAVSAGATQVAKIGAAFPTDLQVSLYADGSPAAGADVTFTAPSSGASGTFSTTGTDTVTVSAGSNGVAYAPVFAANDTAGSYSVLATSPEASSTAVFSLTNTSAGVPGAIVAAGGSSQSATVGEAFPEQLEAMVTDLNGNPIQGAQVTFSLPGESNPGATFVVGGSTTSETTDSAGVATSPPLTADDVAGSFVAVASTPGLPVPAEFSLKNLPSDPAGIVAGLGASQSTLVNTAFLVPLAVTVTDSDNNLVPGVPVTFTAPSNGASGTFGGTGASTVVVDTDSSGVATAPAFVANTIPGGYVVIASTPGVSRPAAFALVNEVNPPTSEPVSSGASLAAPVVGIASTPDGRGYWEVASDGGVFAFGDAQFYGSMGAKPLAAPVVGIASTPDGRGYWEVASDGGVFAFGDAQFYGSMGARP
ncbi:MAG: hypothetical protein ACYCS4_13650, partial [Acidimicrobiales bacterium]